MGKRPFEQVVRTCGPLVWRVCRGVVGPDDADDAWSETFLAALRAYPQLPADANVQAWLVTIAHRKAIDVLRARGRRAVPTDPLPERVAGPEGLYRDLWASPEGLDRDLWAALARLPRKQRACVVYHHIGGLPYAQIADLLGGSPEAARRAAADGIKTLRTQQTWVFDEERA